MLPHSYHQTSLLTTGARASQVSAALSNRLDRILDYHEQHGLWAFPIRFIRNGNSWNKVPCIKWGPFQTRPPTRQARNAFPAASAAAIPTGPATRLLVVDADNSDAIEWVEIRGVPPTVIVRTRHGAHYYFLYPSDLEVHNSASLIHPNVDIRGIGGMVVAAGTVRPDGFTYHYEPGHTLGEVAIAPPPAWLLHLLAAPSTTRIPNRDAIRSLRPAQRSTPLDFAQLAAGIPEGKRDDRLFRLACWCRRRGYSAKQALTVLLDAAQRCQPPFAEQMAAAKVRNAWRYL